MKLSLDWKFALIFVSTLASVAVPVWLWRADLGSRALEFRLVSVSSLAPQAPAPLSGLAVTLDGLPLEAPYLTVVQLINNGTRPIPASDFESGPELRLNAKVSVVKAEVVTTIPADLEAVLIAGRSSVALKPMLLNPGDTLSISILTSGGRPEFQARARVAGVATVSFSDQIKKSPRLLPQLASMFGAFLLALVATLHLNLEPARKFDVHLRGRATYCAFLICVGAAFVQIMSVLDEYDNLSLGYTILILILLLIPARILAVVLNGTPPASPKSPASEA